MRLRMKSKLILHTKMFLRESLLALLEDKPIEKITPTELCRHAGINRNTFYSHYRSPEELLHSMEQELLEKIEASISRQTSFLNTLYAMKNNEYYSRILLSPTATADCGSISCRNLQSVTVKTCHTVCPHFPDRPVK